MKKELFLQKLDQRFKLFTGSYQGLNETQLTNFPVTEAWTIKDLIAHVSWWEQESLSHLPEILKGRVPKKYAVLYGSLDNFNALKTQEKSSLSLKEVLTEQTSIHGQLLSFLLSVHESEFESDSRFIRRLKLDTYSHYPIHAKAISDWRMKNML